MEPQSKKSVSAESLSPHPALKPEPEHTGSIWTHPYSLYIVLTVCIFGFVVIMGCLAWNAGWIPHRTS